LFGRDPFLYTEGRNLRGTLACAGAEEHNQDRNAQDLPYRLRLLHARNKDVEHIIPEILSEEEDESEDKKHREE
jgi:hypothetical protein